MREVIALLVNNLYCLGITNDADVVKISTRTFTALEHHRKSFEYIMFELFARLNLKLCRDRLSPFYPCHDAIRAKEFRNAVYKWLLELKHSGKLDNRALIRRSLLDDSAGERYENLLFYLSTYVYRQFVQTSLAPEILISKWPALSGKDTDFNIHAVYLLQSYRLLRLKTNRQTSKEDFATKAMSLNLLLKSCPIQTVEPINIPCMEEQTKARALSGLELARIRGLVSSQSWLSILEDAKADHDGLERLLPWKVRLIPSHPGRWARDTILSRSCFVNERHKKRLAGIVIKPQNTSRVNRSILKPITSSSDAPLQVEQPLQLDHHYGAKVVSTLKAELSNLKSSFRCELVNVQVNQSDIKQMCVPIKEVVAESTPHRARYSVSMQNSSISIPVLPRKAHGLLKTAIQQRRFLFDDNLSTDAVPQTPQKSRSCDLPDSVKSIGRLIDILNEPDPTPFYSVSPAKPLNYARTSRANQHSLSLWQ